MATSDLTPDPTDPLGVDPILEARRRWDAQIAEDQRRWDAILGTTRPEPPPPMPGPPPQWGYSPSAQIEQHAPADPDELDLTRYDHLATQTAKVHEADDLLPQPPQSPRWIPQESA